MPNRNVLYDEYEVSGATIDLAEKIHEDYGEEPFIMLCVLKGGIYITTSLLQLLPGNIRLEFISASNKASNYLEYQYQIEYQFAAVAGQTLYRIVKDKHVLIVDDIYDTGKTIKTITNLLQQCDAQSIKSCVLLDKPFKRPTDTKGPDYVGIKMTEDHWVYGCGLDNDQYERNLPFVCSKERSQ